MANKSQLNNNCVTMAEKQKAKADVDMSDVQNGPLSEAERECRDLFCCLLFLAAIGAMGYLTYFGYFNGNVNSIFRGVDQNGNICGVSTNTINLPYVYFYNPASSISSRYCFSACPVFSSGSVSTPNVLISGTTPVAANWVTQFDTNAGSVAGNAGGNLEVGYDSYQLLGRFCIPNAKMFLSIFNANTFASVLSQGDLGNFVADIKNNWQYLLAGVGFAFAIGFVVVFLLRCFVGCIVWLSLFSIVLLFVGLALIFFYQAGKIGDVGGVYTYLGVPGATSQYSQTYAWICVGLAGLFLLLILCCCSRIRLAVAVCKCAGQFVTGVCLIILVPIVQAIIGILAWAACVVCMIFIISASKFTATSSSYVSFVESYSDQSMIRFYFFVFGTLWVSAFIGAMTIFVIASACVMWYYSHGPGQELSLPIARSYKMVFRYYFGSLAFGALLLAIVQFIQMIVELIKRQVQNQTGGNKVIQCIFRVVQCCLCCLECIVKFINTQAYIHIAIRGKNFCYAAKDGFEIAWSNAIRFAVVGGVGQVIMFLGKIMIGAGTALGFYLLINYTSIRNSYSQPFYQVILMGLIGYLVGTLFMSIYAVAMDTLLQCFLVDEANQKAKGSGKAKYAPEELAEVMDVDE